MADTLPDPACDPEVVSALRLALLRTARLIRSQTSESDVTQSQLSVIAVLDVYGDATVGELADHERVKPPTMSRLLAAMEERGLVERRANPVDRRCVSITLTAAGREHLAEVRRSGATWLGARMAKLDAADLATLGAAVPVLERLLEVEA